MQSNTGLADYYFHQGTNFYAYEYLGCNLTRIGDKYVYSFRTWAPSAVSVGLISEFTDWNEELPMTRITERGVWELVYESSTSLEYKAYKFRIRTSSATVNKGDPYARFSRGLADGASLIYCESDFSWSDSNWMKHRATLITKRDGHYIPSPVNIYEVHLGSFLRHEDGRVLSYRESADNLASYVKAMGYTHIELLPVMEHPYDGSWGYQVCAFFAPTSRFGTPDDFKYFINKMHSVGIGVILDWVPAHFPKDEWGLYEFDGTPLYEYQGVDRKESRSWGTRFFDLGREEVQSFLISSALYFFREFHVDGLRVDAVASMLYLDYDRLPGEWIPNTEGTNVSAEGVAFFKKLNSAIFAEFPEGLMIAEESGSYGNLTRPVSDGGLGFNMKWNMGWANDFYEYLETDPVFRKHNQRALTFPIMYAFTENYCLPISHDEVVHGKKSFIDKMFGSYEDKFEEMRTALLLMMTYPGKKLTFMGTEFAQFREWNYADMLEWFMLDYPSHSAMRDYVRALNHFYLSKKPLWEIDFSPEGFEWIIADGDEKNSVVYRRLSSDGESLIVALNFSGSVQTYEIEVNPARVLVTEFATGLGTCAEKITVKREKDVYKAKLSLPPFSGAIFTESDGKIKIKI